MIARLAALILCLPAASATRLRLANAFGDNMVLQRNAPINMWGWATAGATIYGALKNIRTNATQRVQALAGADGLFNLLYAPEEGGPGVPYTTLVSTAPISDECILFQFDCDGAALQLSGLLIGDVVLCFGQSNMQVNVGFAFNASEELNAANAYGGYVRIFQSLASVSSKDGPLDDLAQLQLPWSFAGNTTLPEFSATCWYTGENDASAAESVLGGFYACQLTRMVADQRATFGSPGAHWTTVQLAPYTGGAVLGPFRDMQCRTTDAIVNAACAVIDDGGDPLSPIGSVHSRNKQLVGRRVAAGVIPALYPDAPAAQATGPTYAGAALATVGMTGYANVSFRAGTVGGALAGPLVYVPPHVNAWQNASRCPTEIGIPAAACDWLSILGSDGAAYNATAAAVEDGTVLSLQAALPAGVRAIGTRFGYNAWPVVNWYNTAGFPLVPWNVTVL